MIRVFILFNFILLGCVVSSQDKSSIKADKVLNDWKADTMGCSGLRTLSKAKFIKDSLNLVNESKKTMLDYLGRPDNIKIYEGNEIAKYYFESACKEDKTIIDTLDYCWLEFNFEENKIKNISIICY